jgi:hypothetical protein
VRPYLKITKAKKGEEHDSSGRVSASKMFDPEFKPEYFLPQKKMLERYYSNDYY